MTVAFFIYEQLYAKYLCPGECIIEDQGALCNKVGNLLAEKFDCSIHVISERKPQGNGQMEAHMKNLKENMEAFMIDEEY